MYNELVLSFFVFLAAEPTDSVLVKLVLSLLQLCKLAANHPGGADILGIKSNNFHSDSMMCFRPCLNKFIIYSF